MDSMMELAEGLKEELIGLRRALHTHPEVGAELPWTTRFVMEKLTEYGYEPEEVCQSGIVALLQGKPGKTLMLRADMDALPVREKADIPFAASNGNMHACGHDMHTAMLLGAAKLLKQKQNELAGTVKFVFQSNEEGFGGAKAMLAAGVLDSPKVDAAMALHVNSGTPSGVVLCGTGTPMAGCTVFRITINGTGCHGAMPDKGVDPINIAAHIYLSLQALIAREVSQTVPAALTIGRFVSGEAPNIIPETARMEGTIRFTDPETGAFLFRRVEQIAEQTAALFRGQAVVEKCAEVPPLRNHGELTRQLANIIGEVYDPQKVVLFANGGLGSEDFSVYSAHIPCSYLLIGAGTAQENMAFGKPMHNECVVFNEDILPIGCGIFAQCAVRWLEHFCK